MSVVFIHDPSFDIVSVQHATASTVMLQILVDLSDSSSHCGPTFKSSSDMYNLAAARVAPCVWVLLRGMFSSSLSFVLFPVEIYLLRMPQNSSSNYSSSINLVVLSLRTSDGKNTFCYHTRGWAGFRED